MSVIVAKVVRSCSALTGDDFHLVLRAMVNEETPEKPCKIVRGKNKKGKSKNNTCGKNTRDAASSKVAKHAAANNKDVASSKSDAAKKRNKKYSQAYHRKLHECIASGHGEIEAKQEARKAGRKAVQVDLD
jgi:hypothetical protein